MSGTANPSANPTIAVRNSNSPDWCPDSSRGPVLLSNSLLWFAQEEGTSGKTQVRPGDIYEIVVPLRMHEEVTEIEVKDPIGNTTTLPVIDGSASFAKTYLCGTYTFTLGNRELGFGVNLANAAESDIRPSPGFQGIFMGLSTVEQVATPVLERELWIPIGFLLLLLLLGEAYLYHSRIVF